MADSITWLLNADASQVRAEMNAAVSAVNSGTGQMVGGFTRAELAHGSFLKSNAKVSNQMGNVAHAMLYGADSTTVMTTAMEGLAHATKLPLGPLTALVVGGIAIKSVYDYRKEWEKLNLELDKVAKPRAAGENTAKDIEKHAAAAAVVIEKAKEKIEGEGWWGKTKRVVGDWFGGGQSWKVGEGNQDDWRNMRAMQLEPGQKPHDIKRDAEDKIAAARQAQAKDAEDLAKLEHEKLVQAQADKLRDSVQFSLAEIAKEGNKRKFGTFDSSRIYQGDLAQEALNEQMAARKSMMAGNRNEALDHQSRAEQLKASIPALKDSDKIATELVAANITLKEIRAKVTFKRGGAE